MSKHRDEQNVKQVLEIIQDPSWTRDEVRNALKEHGGNVHDVVNGILEGRITSWETATTSKKSSIEVQRLKQSSRGGRGRRGGARGGARGTRDGPRDAPRDAPTDESTTSGDESKVPKAQRNTTEQSNSTSGAPSDVPAEIEKTDSTQTKRKPIREKKAEAPVPNNSTQTTKGFSFADAVAQNTQPKEPEPTPVPVEEEKTEKATARGARGRGRGRGGQPKRETRPRGQKSPTEKPTETTPETETTEATPAPAPVPAPVQQAPVSAPAQPAPSAQPAPQAQPEPAPQAPAPQIPQPQVSQVPPQQPQETPQQQQPTNIPPHYPEGLHMPFNPQTSGVRFGNFQNTVDHDQWRGHVNPQQYFHEYSRQPQRAQEKDDKSDLGAKHQVFGSKHQPNMNFIQNPYGNPNIQGFPYYLYPQFVMPNQQYQYQYQAQQGQKSYPSYPVNKTGHHGYNQYPTQMVQPGHIQQGHEGYHFMPSQSGVQEQKDDEQTTQNGVPTNYNPYVQYYGYQSHYGPHGYHDIQK